jgi:hypothetical protein
MKMHAPYNSFIQPWKYLPKTFSHLSADVTDKNACISNMYDVKKLEAYYMSIKKRKVLKKKKENG